MCQPARDETPEEGRACASGLIRIDRSPRRDGRRQPDGEVFQAEVHWSASRTVVQSVFSTLMRAKCLSLASTSVHGAISVLVRSTMSQTARS